MFMPNSPRPPKGIACSVDSLMGRDYWKMVSRAQLRGLQTEPDLQGSIDPGQLFNRNAPDAASDSFPPGSGDFVDHDLRFLLQSIRGTRIHRQTDGWPVLEVGSQRADGHAGVGRIEQVRLNDQGRTWFAIVAGERAQNQIATLHSQ